MTRILLTLALSATWIIAISQEFPESLSYQAIIRDEQANILANSNLNVRFSIILDDLGQYTDVYTETQQTITNNNGLLNLSIGNGTPGNGLVANFMDIDWSLGYLLKVEFDMGNGFVDLGLEPLNSVPYSMYSKENWALNGNANIDENTHFIGTSNFADLHFKTNNSHLLTLSKYGKVGIGTTTPAELMHLRSNNDNRTYIRFEHAYNENTAYAGLDGNDFYIWNQGVNGAITFRSDNGTLSLDEDGKVGINTENPFVSLHITEGTDLSLENDLGGFLLLGPTYSNNMVFDQNEIVARNNGSAATLFLNTEAGAVVINENSTPPYDFYVFGTAAKPGGGSWSSYSDVNLKQGIKSFDAGLETLLKVNPVNFKYIPEFSPDPKTEYVGIIAQELQIIAPYMVQSAPTVFEDGHVEEYLSVDPSAFTYMLINAVKELNEQNENLKKQLEIQQDNYLNILNEIQNIKTSIQAK